MSPLLRRFLVDKALLLVLLGSALAPGLGLVVLTKTPLLAGLVVGRCGRGWIVRDVSSLPIRRLVVAGKK